MQSMLQILIGGIGTAAKSPLAFAAYAIAAGVWLAYAWLRSKPQLEARRILQQFKSDAERTRALALLVGAAPPSGLTPDATLDWVRLQLSAKTKLLLLIGYITTLLVIVTLVAVAVRGAVQGDPTLVIDRATSTEHRGK